MKVIKKKLDKNPTNKRINSQLTKKERACLDSKLLGYTVLAAGILVTSDKADGAIQYFSLSAITINSSNPTSNWDIDNDATPDFQIHYNSTVPYLSARRLNANNAWVRNAISSSSYIDVLPTATIIGPTLPTNYAFQNVATVFFTNTGTVLGGLSNGSNLVGFQFNAGGIRYGWAEFQLASNQLTITRWAYENTGQPIQTGEVPEPNSLAYLIAGYVGLVEMRRRRKARAEGREAELK